MIRRISSSRNVFICALIVLSMASFTVASPVSAQSDGETDEIVKGGANSWAQSVTIELGIGGAALGATYGRSIASYRDVSAESEGLALDLGLLASIFGLPQCGGALPPAWDPDTLPAKSVVDSFTKDSEKGTTAQVLWPTESGKPKSEVAIGEQSASAGKKPWSKATTNLVIPADLVLLKVFGAETSSFTEFSEGTRIAKAESWATDISLMGGLLHIKNPHWTVEARSGAENSESASFTFEWVRMYGQYVRPGGDATKVLNDFKWAVEQLLSGLGLSFEIPETIESEVGDGITITPLGFSLADAPIGKDLLVPLLGSDFMDLVRQDSLEQDCTNETIWTIIDALGTSLGGGGQVDILVGGATATTDETDFSSPPLPPPPPTQPPTTEVPTTLFVAAPPPPIDTSGGFTSFTPGTPDIPGTAGTDGFETSTEAGDGVEEAAVVDEPELEEIAAPAKPKTTPAGSSGPAVAVGIAALLGALALSGGDRIMGRRNKRQIT